MRLLGSINDDVLIGGDLADELLGGDGNDLLDGRDGSDSLYGQGGDDTLIGGIGAGSDLYDGGAGRDLLSYYEALAGVRVDLSALTDQGRSLVGDSAGIGIDQIRGIEDVEGTAFGDILTGNGFANLLIGREGNDTLSGGAGDDRLMPGTGDDRIIGGGGYDTVDYSDFLRPIYLSLGVTGAQNTGAGRDSFVGVENAIGGQGNDVLGGSATHNFLSGLGGDDRLSGGAGNDTLDGGTGADRMTGGTGNDTFHVDDAADTVLENVGEGTDTVILSAAVSYTLGANVENLTALSPSPFGLNPFGNPGGITLTGNDLSNVLTAGAGTQVLDGGAGADRMIGGLGGDLYYVDNVRDVVVETAEMAEWGPVRDMVRASVSYTLGANVEWLKLEGSADLSGTGNALDNRLEGNEGANHLRGSHGRDDLIGGAGDDTLDGGTGQDYMQGGLGDDTYIVDDSNDYVWEGGNEGTDTVASSVTYYLYDSVENLTLTGTGATNGFGSWINNTLKGNDAANGLHGYGGDDLLYGNGGQDFLMGHEGNDRLQGGSGTDVLLGGSGSDLFVFYDSDFEGTTPAANSCDVISDFYSYEGDRISLGRVDANASVAGDQAFTFIDNAAFSGTAGELRAFEQNGNTMIEGDVNGDGAADFAIELIGVKLLTTMDFVL